LRVTQERWPQIVFHETREHASKLSWYFSNKFHRLSYQRTLDIQVTIDHA
jgi:hypothetical protein